MPRRVCCFDFYFESCTLQYPLPQDQKCIRFTAAVTNLITVAASPPKNDYNRLRTRE